ncbi:hypothetical protein BRD02_01640 [Halobacteriales archaeon QS_8_69_73]|nr:MAG: hypothetical protein BRD02_01640 [Halobacteriales archaeon QS_8_69_73]
MLQLGVTYNTRVIGVNPPNPQGTLRADDLGDITLNGAVDRTSGESLDTSDICGTTGAPQNSAIRYDPSYVRLSDEDSPQLVYENTVLYRETESDVLVQSDQALIQGSSINILPVQSTAVRSSQQTSLSLSSSGYKTVKQLKPGANIIITTNIPKEKWDKLLPGYVSVDSDPDTSNKVKIKLGDPPGEVPWRVRCAITTDGDVTVEDGQVSFQQNGGVGRAGTTEHTPDSNTDKIVIPNGKWTKIDNIAGIKHGNTEETVPVEGSNNVEGDGVILEYTIRDDTGEEVEVNVEAAYDPGNEEYVGEVGFSDDPVGDPIWMELRTDAARQLIEGGVEDGPDILDDSNYIDTFRNADDVRPLVGAILGMEDATLQTTDVAGRVDMKVESGELSLSIDDEDRSRIIKKGETSEIEFDVTAMGEMEGSENVDLVVRDSSGQRIDDIGDRADRQTLAGVDGEESFTLTWEPDWDQIDDGEYQILVEGESDQAFATVEVFQGGNIRLNVTIDDATSPVDYGDTVETNVTIRNVGDTDADDAQLDLSMAGQDGPQPQFDLAAGENTTLALEYDTQEKLNPTDTGEKTLKATWNGESTDTETVVVERPDIILDPQAEDLTAGEDGQTQTFEFTLGEDLTADDEISVDVSDTSDAVEYDGNDGSWTIIQGDGTEVSPDLDNGKVTYKVGSDDSEGDTIRFQGSGISAASAESDIRYDVEYRVESADSYAVQNNGDTASTSFESKDDIVKIEILDAESPVEYGETVETNIRVENVGSTDAEDVQLDVSVADRDGRQPEFDLEAGEETTITTNYDTSENLDPSDIGRKTLEVTWNDESTDTETVVVEQPDVIHKPYVENVTATDGNQTQAFGFTLNEELEKGDEISVDISDTEDDIRYDGNDSNWTVIRGPKSAQVTPETDNGTVTYVAGGEETEDDIIRIRADFVNASSAEPDTRYDVEYRVESAGPYAAQDDGDTNSTSFEST